MIYIAHLKFLHQLTLINIDRHDKRVRHTGDSFVTVLEDPNLHTVYALSLVKREGLITLQMSSYVVITTATIFILGM